MNSVEEEQLVMIDQLKQKQALTPEKLVAELDFVPQGVLTDVDGTLANEQKVLTPVTQAAIRNCYAEDLSLGLCTGRHYATLKRTVLPLFLQQAPEQLHVVCGGAMVINSRGETVWEKSIASELAEEICRRARELGGEFAFGQGDLFYCSPVMLEERLRIWGGADVLCRSTEGLTNWSTPILVVSHDNPQLRRYMENLGEELTVKRIFGKRSGYYYDVTLPGVNKGVAAQVWAEHQGLDLRHVLALGDSDNDLEVLQEVGVGIAMGNATPEIQQQADFVLSLSNEDNGVAKLLDAVLAKRAELAL